MAVRISDLDAIGVGQIAKGDMLEIERLADRKSYRASAQAIGEFCKSLNNGGFKGSTTKSLDEFTYADAGVYWWSGTAPLVGIASSGVLEILSATPPDETPTETPSIVERLISGKNVWQRMGYANNWSSWAALTNQNGNSIFCGKENADVTSVTFPATFSQAPAVICTPVTGNDNSGFYVINVENITRTGFTVRKYKLNFLTPATVTSTETNNTYTTAGSDQKLATSNSETTVTVSNNSWTKDDVNVAFSWIATVEIPNSY